ncbi:hypothetical protein QTP88_012273 [Uroleucon formosanum]
MLSEKKDLTPDFFKSSQKVAAEACGVSYITLRRICVEAKKSTEQNVKEGPSFKSPRKLYKRQKKCSEMDDFDADVVRRTVHSFYDKGEYPTALLILNELKKKMPNYEGSVWSVRRLLKNLNFSFKKCNDGRKMLLERNDIVALRCKFLRNICTLRQMKDCRPMIYLDETWVNQNHSRSHIWQNNEGTEGLKVPIGKGGRLIITHAGSSRYGFIEGSKLVFKCQAKNSTDYHSSMNADVFKAWFVDMLKLLPEPCVIIMDNAPYHSMYINNYPKCNTRKADVQNWLKNQGVNFSPLETLPELRERLKLLIPSFKRYELDEIASSMGHEVIRLPPYHCQYNPIELIWAQVKNEVAKKNNTFKMVDVERLTNEALDSVSKSDWEKCVEHAEKIQDEDYEKEILRDSLTEPMTLTFASDDSDFERVRRRFLIEKIKGLGSELKTLEERDCRHESESVAIRNLLGGSVDISLSASMIAKHSAVYEEAVDGRLLVKEICNSGMKIEYPAEIGETEPSV